MAKQYDDLNDALGTFLLGQHIFFTASATADSRVNLSPRESAALRILDASTVCYLDRTGSGNETAAHMLADGRLTIMTCALNGPPQILRLYGRGESVGWDTAEFAALIAEHYGSAPLGTRQIVKLHIELVQTSCGYGVPTFNYTGERAAIENWHQNKGPDGIRDYWQEKNQTSLDGLPTGLKVPVA